VKPRYWGFAYSAATGTHQVCWRTTQNAEVTSDRDSIHSVRGPGDRLRLQRWQPCDLAVAGHREQVAVAGSTSSHAAHAAVGGNEVNDTDLRSIIRAAVDDAARRTGRAVVTLQVISSEAVTWPDGSLGCPEPGVTYTMAPVPGCRVRIQAGDTVLDYYTSRRGYLVLCPSERATREKTSQLGLVPSGVSVDPGFDAFAYSGRTAPRGDL
jgi:hypothetical protein